MTTYYVSGAGNDSADGLTTGTSWATCAKVNSFSFSFGDKILFKRGDIWREILEPSSDGITIADYGTGELPRFSGSETIAQGEFSQHSGDTYTAPLTVATEHDIVYSGRFLLRVADVATVGTSANSYYHDGTDLYINVGGAPTDVENCVRNKCIYINNLSNVRLRNLRTENTMRDDIGSISAGYGILVFLSDNVTIVDCKGVRHQKHHFGDISSREVLWKRCYTATVGNNLDSSGATHYVSYGALAQETAGNSRWLACTTGDCISADGTNRYSMICHGDAIRRLLIHNCRFNSSINLVNQADNEDQQTDEWRVIHSAFNGKILLGATQANGKIAFCTASAIEDNGTGNILQGNTII